MARQTESFCINHQDRPAVARCKQCSKPICKECVISTDLGSFCSDFCSEQAQKFAERIAISEEMHAAGRPSRSARKLKRLIKNIITLVIIIVIIGAVLYFVFDVRNFSDLVNLITGWF